jgi:hypothetical protein
VRLPDVHPSTADSVLKLIDYARDEAPQGPLEWLMGWLTARASQSVQHGSGSQALASGVQNGVAPP